MSFGIYSAKLQKNLDEILAEHGVWAVFYVGVKLQLFEKLFAYNSDKGPITSETFAEWLFMKPEYIKYWCRTMALADIIMMNEKEEYWVEMKNVDDLVTKNGGTREIVAAGLMAGNAKNLMKCMPIIGPMGFQSSNELDLQCPIQPEEVQRMDLEQMGIITTNDIQTKNLRFLSVRSFESNYLVSMAKYCKGCQFVSANFAYEMKLEDHEKLVLRSVKHENLKILRIENSAFELERLVGKMKFDVIVINGFHHVTKPDELLRSLKAVMDKNGKLVVKEYRCKTDVSGTWNIQGPGCALPYAQSFLHCIPTMLNQSKCTRFGKMIPEDEIRALMRSNGFEDHSSINFESNVSWQIWRLLGFQKHKNFFSRMASNFGSK